MIHKIEPDLADSSDSEFHEKNYDQKSTTINAQMPKNFIVEAKIKEVFTMVNINTLFDAVYDLVMVYRAKQVVSTMDSLQLYSE
jgi:hypothetical protein